MEVAEVVVVEEENDDGLEIWHILAIVGGAFIVLLVAISFLSYYFCCNYDHKAKAEEHVKKL